MLVRVHNNRWRAIGLLVAATAYAALLPGTPGIRLAAALGFATALLCGARFQQVAWIVSGMRGLPPRGGQWADALCCVAAWTIALRFGTGLDVLAATCAGLWFAQGFAKLSCARLGCCSWKRVGSGFPGQIVEATFCISSGATVLLIYAWVPRVPMSVALGLTMAIILLRSFSLVLQGRRIMEKGSVAILGIILAHLSIQ